MIELVVPEALADHSALDDERLSLTREMVARQVYAFKGELDEGARLASTLSEATGGSPVLLNHVTEQTDTTRTVDVYMHQNGQQMSVSEDVEKPMPDGGA